MGPPCIAPYFNGYALWTYLTWPFLFALDGVAVREIEPVEDNGQTWRAYRRICRPSRSASTYRSSTSETILCGAHDFASTWQEASPPSNTSATSSKPKDQVSVQTPGLPRRRRRQCVA